MNGTQPRRWTARSPSQTADSPRIYPHAKGGDAWVRGAFKLTRHRLRLLRVVIMSWVCRVRKAEPITKSPTRVNTAALTRLSSR